MSSRQAMQDPVASVHNPKLRSILILGGTAEAYELANLATQMPSLSVTTSLAGRTQQPQVPQGQIRIGGFGGAAGLAEYLRQYQIQRVVDATHPFAIAISQQVAIATAQLGIPLLRLHRRAWEPQLQDQWILVANLSEAATLLPGLAERVFLSIGRQDLAAFCGISDLWFLMRIVDCPREGVVFPKGKILRQRGPFSLVEERTLLETYQIQALVSKNSGGIATYAKILAARELGLPVVMVQRPQVVIPGMDRTTVEIGADDMLSLNSVINWLLS